MHKRWKCVLEDLASGDLLLSNDSLDNLAIASIDDDVIAPIVICDGDFAADEPDADLNLGKAGKGVPEDVHRCMEEAFLAGQISLTSLKQRARNVCKNCVVPVGLLTAAARYGYISPNLPPPPGVKWACRAGTWTLVPRGG